MRINRYLAAAGLCSRRAAEDYVRQGRVKVNNKRVDDLSTRVAEKDTVTVDDQPLYLPATTIVYAYHKPVGITVTLSDPKQTNLLSDQLGKIPERVVPVGRLDKDSSGLLLLTNDGELVHRLTHPSFEKAKIYEVSLDRAPTAYAIKQFEKGIPLDGQMTSPASVQRTRKGLRIRLTEGRNRQIRRMWAYLGYTVVRLHRVEVDGISLGALPPNKFRVLTEEEVEQLK